MLRGSGSSEHYKQTNPTNSNQPAKSDNVTGYLCRLAVGEFLAEDGNPVGVGSFGFLAEFDLDFGMHHASRLGEEKVVDRVIAIPPPFDANALGESTQFLTGHCAKGGQGGRL